MERFKRITVDPNILNGKPCIRGMRFPAYRILQHLAAGDTPEIILKDFPDLETGDIQEAIEFAAWVLQGNTVEIK